MVLNETWDLYPEPNITGFYDSFIYANSVTNDLFTPMIMIGVFIVMFLGFRKAGDDVGFAASSFICMILAGMLRASSALGDIWLVLFGVMGAVSMVVLYRRG